MNRSAVSRSAVSRSAVNRSAVNRSAVNRSASSKEIIPRILERAWLDVGQRTADAETP